jgi:hypothetical protein
MAITVRPSELGICLTEISIDEIINPARKEGNEFAKIHTTEGAEQRACQPGRMDRRWNLPNVKKRVIIWCEVWCSAPDFRLPGEDEGLRTAVTGDAIGRSADLETWAGLGALALE